MDKILEFLDFSSIDPQMYWRLHAQDSDKTYEISWRRDSQIRWRFRECGALFWTLSKTEEIVPRLEALSIDLEDFEQAIKTSLLHQVCFADRIVKDSRELLGDELIDAGIADHDEFLKSIGVLVEQMKPMISQHGSHLRVVKD